MSEHKNLPNIFVWSHPRSLSTAFLRPFSSQWNVYLESFLLSRSYFFLQKAIAAGAPNLPDPQQLFQGSYLPENEGFSALVNSFKEPFIYKEHAFQTDNGMKLEEEKETLLKGRHLFIIRNPESAVPSLINILLKDSPNLAQHPHMALLFNTFGFDKNKPQENLYLYLSLQPMIKLIQFLKANGQTPILVESEELVANPEGTFKHICSELGVEFNPAMLTWSGDFPAIPPILAKWFTNANKSEGFSPDLTNKNPYETIPEPYATMSKQMVHVLDQEYKVLKQLFGK